MKSLTRSLTQSSKFSENISHTFPIRESPASAKRDRDRERSENRVALVSRVTKLGLPYLAPKTILAGPSRGSVRPVHIRYLFKAVRHGRFATHSPYNSTECARTRACTCVCSHRVHARIRERVIDIGTAKSLALSTPNSKC